MIKEIYQEELFSEFISLIRENRIDFIAFAISHWHAIGVEAEIKSRQFTKGGLIIILPHPKDGVLLAEEQFKGLVNNENKIYIMKENKSQNLSVIMRQLVGFFKSQLLNSKQKNEIKIICPLKPYFPILQIFNDTRLARNVKVKYILIDEGIGSYASQKAWQKIKKVDQGNNKKLKILKWVVSKVINKVYMRLDSEKRFLFKSENGILYLNEAVAKQYQNVLNRSEVKNNEIAIVVTQPFSEYYFISEKDELRVTKEIIDKLLHAHKKVVLKPHPREKMNKYNDILNIYSKEKVSLIEENISLERLLEKMNPGQIVGYTSTALLNAKALYDIDSYSAVKYMELYALDEDAVEIWREYYNLNRAIVKEFII
ncbi:hypothetical protein E2K98_04510 [Bacillus salipaludis]|uniref:Uncharacterized protein n=1 Tax=Bacillus salipaludis TaxID=2547811 RepID=A0A4R5VXU3_9BACI|nr:polysialyltransferase family glycosyltransferase [Bacillus salipaludis]TDK64132.1 hypothetical protein E2K98_04510 [Bacillus salipaludis]